MSRYVTIITQAVITRSYLVDTSAFPDEDYRDVAKVRAAAVTDPEQGDSSESVVDVVEA